MNITFFLPTYILSYLLTFSIFSATLTSLCLFGSLGEFAVKLKATIDKISSFFALVKGPKVFRRKIGMISSSYQNRSVLNKLKPSCEVTVTFLVAMENGGVDRTDGSTSWAKW